MEKEDHTSPVPTSNLFDQATLLGVSPFGPGLNGFPYAHLAHLPGAFSLLGHPAFPVTSLFGCLDGLNNPLCIPSSLASSLSPNSAKFGLFNFSSAYSSPSLSKSSTTFTNSTKTSSSSSRDHRSGTGSRGRTRKPVKQSAIPLSLVQSTSTLSSLMLEKYAVKHTDSNGIDSMAKNAKTSEKTSNKTSASSLFNVSFDKDGNKLIKPLPSPKTRSSPLISPNCQSPSKPSNTGVPLTSIQDKVHIDSLKKKLIGDQIRQRMQLKTSSSLSTSSSSSIMKGSSGSSSSCRRRKGRPHKISENVLSIQELEKETGKQKLCKSENEQQSKNHQSEMEKKFYDEHSWRESKPRLQTPNNVNHGHLLTVQECSTDIYPKPETSTSHKLTSDDKAVNIRKYSITDTSSNGSGTMDSKDMENGDISYSDWDQSDDSDDSDDDNIEDGGGSIDGKRKAKQEYNASGRPIKRRHVVLDDSKIRVPLAKGWRRQTNIHSYGRRGIVGEVWYFAPCGRKMKTIPDVMRYIERNNISDLGRDQFSFSTKVNVGDFYEARINSGEPSFVKLTEYEIQDRLSVTVSRRLKKIENQKKQDKMKMHQILTKQLLENKMKQQLDQQEQANKHTELQLQKRMMEQDQQKKLLKRVNQLKLLEKRKQRDQFRQLREQERKQREEQLRLKQVMRAHQLLEKRLWRLEEQERRKYIKAVKIAEGRELKRQQVTMLKEQMRLIQEQERRQHHMFLLKALEQKKKQEDREKQKEEKMAKRRLSKERKVEQKKMEFVLAQELKKPREDMELRDARPLPEFPRIPGNCLDGDAFADCLMSLEFLHNFAKPLGFDSETLPTLKSLQDAVVCKTEEDGEEYLSLVTHLLRYALDDPGVPNPKEAVTKLGQKIVDMEVTDVILSEVLRIFLVARNGGESELSEYLRTYPLEACNISQRAAVVAFLCNELNCSRNITTEIESHLDQMADIRHEKWIIEGKLRRLRTLRSKKFPQSEPSKPEDTMVTGTEDSLVMEDSMMTLISKQSDDDEEKEDGSCNEEESFNEGEAQEDDPTTAEECEKLMEKLQKQHTHQDKVFTHSHYVRAVQLGCDRYKRNYWVLPHVGGVFIEGMESGEIRDIKSVSGEKSDVKSVKIEVIDEKTEQKVDFLHQVSDTNVLDLPKTKQDSSIVDMTIYGNTKIGEEREKIGEVKIDSNGIVKHDCDEKMNFNNLEENSKLSASDIQLNCENFLNEKFGAENEFKELFANNADDRLACVDRVISKVVNREISELNDGICQGDIIPAVKQSHSNSGLAETMKPSSKHVELKIPNIKSSAIETDKVEIKSNVNNVLQVRQSSKLSDLCEMSLDDAIKSETNDKNDMTNDICAQSSSLFCNSSFLDHVNHVTKSSNHIAKLCSLSRPPPAHSKTPGSEQKPSFMSIDSILEKKTGSSQNNQLFLNSVLPANQFVCQSIKTNSESHVTNNKQWFSILPRIPCDDMSLTRGQHSSLSSGMLLSSPFVPQLSFHPLPIQNTLTSFQMGQLFNSCTHQTLTSSVTSMSVATASPSSDSSFKKPEPVICSQNADPVHVLRSLQGEAKPIPEEFKKGWWKTVDAEQVHQLLKCLHPRGIREKHLQKAIQKCLDYTLASCSAGADVLCMESSSDDDITVSEEEDDEDITVKQEKDKLECIDKLKLEHESAEILNESGNIDSEINDLQKSTECTEDSEPSKEENSSNGSVKSDHNNKKKDIDKMKWNNKKKEKVQKKVLKKKSVPFIDCKAHLDEADRLVLEEVETLEDRIATASLQIKGWKLAPKSFSEVSDVHIVSRGEVKNDENYMYPLEAAKERLLQLELNIERRYLKPPLSKAHRISLNSMSSSSASHIENMDDGDSEYEFENLPIGLQMWRIAVGTATSPAQLMLCVRQLNSCLSWEKSIMKVLCQICRKDDNEAELLLCDGCDRGYHTYCFKPKLESVPDGDWYCFECVSKTLGESCCLVCGRRYGRMAECNLCNRCIHIDCLEPPLPRVPRKWLCTSCNDSTKGSAKKIIRKNSEASVLAPFTPVPPDLTPTGRKRRCDFGVPRKHKSSESQSETDSPQKKQDDSPPNTKPTTSDRQMDKREVVQIGGQVNIDDENKKIQSAEQSSDLKICRLLLTEMMKHEDGWPFLQPVNCKHSPSYRKYIKSPMDFGTMKIKLRDHVYQMRNEFLNDANLVFDNCQLFNEDDSEVGQCGHTMRQYFTNRWRELLLDSSEESS